jgi:hypothetical protein
MSVALSVVILVGMAYAEPVFHQVPFPGEAWSALFLLDVSA